METSKTTHLILAILTKQTQRTLSYVPKCQLVLFLQNAKCNAKAIYIHDFSFDIRYGRKLAVFGVKNQAMNTLGPKISYRKGIK